MNGKLNLTFSVATFIAAIGLLLSQRCMNERLNRVEQVVQKDGGGRPVGAYGPRTNPAGTRYPDEPDENGGEDEVGDGDYVDPIDVRDPLVKLDYLIEKIREMEDDNFESYSDLSQDLIAIKREIGYLKSSQRRLIRGLASGGGLAGFAPTLPKLGTPIDGGMREKFMKEAAAHGVKVEEGRVSVRGFLNMSPRTNMPIEFFVTRYPESSHETLVHLVGDKSPAVVNENPYRALAGLPTAVYKGMLAAGFEQGMFSRPDPDSDPQDPKWLLATGDTVYVYLKYENDEGVHVARATDWVIDPSTGTVLPHDCFKFGGSMRHDDFETGEEALLSESRGLIVTVWPNAGAIVEVALQSSLLNNYQYNFERIPELNRETELFLEVIFSKEPLDVKGDGAKPIAPPKKAPAKDDDEGEDK